MGHRPSPFIAEPAARALDAPSWYLARKHPYTWISSTMAAGNTAQRSRRRAVLIAQPLRKVPCWVNEAAPARRIADSCSHVESGAILLDLARPANGHELQHPPSAPKPEQMVLFSQCPPLAHGLVRRSGATERRFPR